MVRKKATSKRMTLKNKYKIVAKSKEKKRKERRDARRNPNLRKKLKKDPGIPNLYPFKEQFLGAMKKSQEREKAQQRRDSINGNKRKREIASFDEMQQDAQKRQKLHDESMLEEGLENNTVNDTSRKSFYNVFKEVVKASDVIIEVLDARDPIGTRSVSIENQILSLDPNKRIVLVLNKIDLVPRSNLEGWLAYLRNEMPTVAFKASVQQQRRNIGVASMKKYTGDLSGVSECIGAPGLIELLKNYSRSYGVKKSITVGIIGFPNVGKSSIINSLKRTKVAGVGATPGFTTKSQTVVLDSNIKLLDCPGIIFDPGLISASDAALRNCVKFEQIDDPLLPIEAIIKRCNRENLMELYQIGTYRNPTEFLNNIAQRRGKLKQGGVSDIMAAAKIILLDWNTGKIPYYTIPPNDKSHVSSSIVQQYSEEFDMNSIMEIERDMLSGLEDNDYGYSSFTSEPLTIEMNMDSSSDDEKPEVVVNIKKKNPRVENTKAENAADEINPQLNKKMREIIENKKEKKKKESGDQMEEEEFNFTTDFWENHEGDVVEMDGFTF